jgi:glycosyltransferase involved in cell wall biosynthesis
VECSVSMQEGKREVIIIFPDNWLDYSPTVINISKILSRHFHVTVISAGKKIPSTDIFGNHTNITPKYIDIEGRFIKRVITTTDRVLIFLFSSFLKIKLFDKGWLRELLVGNNVENFYRLIKFRRYIRSMVKRGDVLIGVDNVGILAATRFSPSAHMVSLEIAKNIFYYFIKWPKVKSLIIQTKERKDYLLSKIVNVPNTFFIQNAPTFNHSLSGKKNVNNFRIVYLGNLALEYNGLNHVVNSLAFLPSNYTIVFKGPYNERSDRYFKENYAQLMCAGRLCLDYEYVNNEDLYDYLGKFSIGITLYDIDSLKYKSFNVVSCPSGKLFNYYNAGLPVIGNNILGLSSIRDFDCGILIDELSGKNIALAVGLIANNYDHYAENSKKAAFYFDFERGVNKFIEKELL